MIRQKAALMILVFGLCLTHANASPSDSAKVKSVLQSIYAKENAAAADRDAQGSVAYLSPSFKGTDAKGAPVSYDDLLSSVTQVFSMASSIHSETNVSSCVTAGNKATVKTGDVTTMIVQGMTLVDKSTTLDTWTKTKAGWRMIGSRILSHAATVNGQPAPE